MQCVDAAMRYKVMRKADALQISPPIRQTSPGGRGVTHRYRVVQICTDADADADEQMQMS